MKKTLDWSKYLETAAQTVAEGIVMLKNDSNALPLQENSPVSVFGRIQLHYYKSGTGSGALCAGDPVCKSEGSDGSGF